MVPRPDDVRTGCGKLTGPVSLSTTPQGAQHMYIGLGTLVLLIILLIILL
jgi:hypothetical protein